MAIEMHKTVQWTTCGDGARARATHMCMNNSKSEQPKDREKDRENNGKHTHPLQLNATE